MLGGWECHLYDWDWDCISRGSYRAIDSVDDGSSRDQDFSRPRQTSKSATLDQGRTHQEKYFFRGSRKWEMLILLIWPRELSETNLWVFVTILSIREGHLSTSLFTSVYPCGQGQVAVLSHSSHHPDQFQLNILRFPCWREHRRTT